MEVVVSGKPTNEKKKKYEDWEINSWARTLEEAEEIKRDPEKMKLIKPIIKKKVLSIDALKKLANEKEDDETEE